MESINSHVIILDDADADVGATYDAFTDPIATQKWNDHTVSYYFKSIRDVAPYLSTWRFNRKINEDHKNTLKAALIATPHPHLMGTIQVMRDKKGNCRVMNGQHRIVATLEILEADINMEFNMNIMFEVYDTSINDLNDYADHEDAEQLFKIANTSLALEPEDEHDVFCRKLVNAMGQDKVLSKGLVDKTVGTVHRPRIVTKTMFELFKQHLPSNHGMEISDIINKMKQINVQFSLMPNVELFGRHQPADAKQKQRAKAHQIGFFLNLDCKYTPADWIPWLLISSA